MKKTFAILAVAMMMFATGCGKDNKPVEDVKQDANAAVEQVKEKADEAKQDATQAVETAKENVKETAQAILDDAKKTMDDLKNGAADKTVIALDGIVPGINIETVNAVFGDPIESDGTNFAYSNGIDIKVKDNIVQEVSTKYDGLNTPSNIAVGMAEDALKAAYGDKMTVTKNDDGSSVYKFVASDNRRAIEFTTSNGSVTKITATLNQ